MLYCNNRKQPLRDVCKEKKDHQNIVRPNDNFDWDGLW